MDSLKRLIIALNNVDTSNKVEVLLRNEGYEVMAICTSSNELIRRVMQDSPDLVIMSYKLSDVTILDINEKLGDMTSFLAIANETYRSFIQEGTDIYCIGNPISKVVLLNTLDLIFQNQRRISRLREKVVKLEQTIEDRKLIDKAKGILMRDKKMTEQEAFRYIQKISMDNGLKMSDVAKSMLKQET